MTLDFNAILTEEMEWAITQKRSLGVGREHENDFRMRVSVIGPAGELLPTSLGWGSHEQKKEVMHALSTALRESNFPASAVMIATDSRYLLNDKFCAHFGLEIPTPETLTVFNQARRRIMEPFGHDMGKLPRTLWQEALNVMVRGPRVASIATTRYHVEADKFFFEPTKIQSEGEEDCQQVRVPMVPPWWQR